MDAGACALVALCSPRGRPRREVGDGKRPWFDRLGQDRIYIRHAYREPRRETGQAATCTTTAGGPIRRFYCDLS